MRPVHLPGGLLIRLIRPVVWLLIARLPAHRRALHGLTAHRVAPRRIRIVLRRILIARLPAHAALRLIPCVARLSVRLLIIPRIVPLACAHRLPLRSELCTLEALARAVLRIVVLRVRALRVLRVREALAHAVLRIIVGILAVHGVSAALRILPVVREALSLPVRHIARLLRGLHRLRAALLVLLAERAVEQVLEGAVLRRLLRSRPAGILPPRRRDALEAGIPAEHGVRHHAAAERARRNFLLRLGGILIAHRAIAARAAVAAPVAVRLLAALHESLKFLLGFIENRHAASLLLQLRACSDESEQPPSMLPLRAVVARAHQRTADAYHRCAVPRRQFVIMGHAHGKLLHLNAGNRLRSRPLKEGAHISEQLVQQRRIRRVGHHRHQPLHGKPRQLRNRAQEGD